MRRAILRKIKNDNILLLIRKILKKFKDIYLVGGAIRDYGLGIEPKEYDFVVKEPENMAEYLSKKLKMNCFKLGNSTDYVFRISIGEGGVDFSPIKSESIEDNLKKRDFTIDSIGIDLVSFEVSDPLGGLKDIKNKKIRMTSKKTFEDDPLRILKGYRLKCIFPELEFDKFTKKEIDKSGDLLKKIAPERIQIEISKILSSQKCAGAIEDMFKNGIFIVVFPLLSKLKGVPQSFPHKTDVLNHTLDMLRFLDENIYLSHLLSLRSNFSENIMKLRFAIIFHDAGKKDTFLEDKRGIHFYGHEKKSAKIVQRSLSKLKYSKKMVKEISSICELHMRPLLLFKEKNCSIRAKRRLIKDSGEDFPLLMVLSFIDFSTMMRSQKEIEEYYSFCEEMFSLYQKSAKEILFPPKLINGLEAMKILGLREKGPDLGSALKCLRQEQIDGNIKNREEAVAFLEKYRRNIFNSK